jgi:hypothetical protein
MIQIWARPAEELVKKACILLRGLLWRESIACIKGIVDVSENIVVN